MGDSVRDRLDAVEAAAFVGRRAELAQFEALLRDATPSRQVVFVHGPGGVGTSTLLRELQRRCRHHGQQHVFLDARRVEPTRVAVLDSIGAPLGVGGQQTLEALEDRAERLVVMIDTWQRLAPLEAWIRRQLVPSLSDQCILVLAGRSGPGPAWRTHPGLRSLVVDMALRNLPPDDSRDLLARLGVPADVTRDVLRFTHGHPLALALVGDVCAQGGGRVGVEDAALDAIPVLLERLASDATTPIQRAALEAASVVRVTSEPVLAAMLAIDDAHEQFAWLRGLACMEAERDGLRPHDVVRAALATDLHWRNPQRHAQLHARARHHLHERFEDAPVADQQAVLLDLLFLHRDNPVVAPFFDWDVTGPPSEDAQPADTGPILAAVQRHEGRDAAAIQEHWVRHPAASTTVVRGEEADVLGFVTSIELSAVDLADLAPDPVARAVAAHMEAESPLRPGEVALLFRSWMSLEDHQTVSTVQSAIFLHVARCYLTTPRLARSFFCAVDGDFWEPFSTNFDITRIPGVEFTEPPGLGVFEHDWRVRPPLEWLDLVATRETNRQPTPPPPTKGALVVLSEPDFRGAVRDALRDLHNRDGLARNPLLRSRVVVERCVDRGGPAEGVTVLGDLVRRAASALEPDPRRARGHRAVHHTWIEPAGTQEQVAEALDLPFSSYRRHLGEGLDNIVASLWQLELEPMAVGLG